MHEGMDGWKENGCPPALEAGVEVGWGGKAGVASDVTRGDWKEGSGRLNGIEGLLGRKTARLPASHHHHHRRWRGLGRGSPCSGFQEEQLVCHFCGRRKHPECPDVSATHALLIVRTIPGEKWKVPVLWEVGGASGSSGICCLTVILDFQYICVCAQSLSHVLLCGPTDCSTPGSSAQAGVLD